VCRSKHVETSINFGIINYITKLLLVGIYAESYCDARIHEYRTYKCIYTTSASASASASALVRQFERFDDPERRRRET
jgi:hypothetical protein